MSAGGGRTIISRDLASSQKNETNGASSPFGGSGESPEMRAKRQLEAHLSDPFTSRDLFGVVRGRCTTKGCSACPGGYLKRTADYTVRPEETEMDDEPSSGLQRGDAKSKAGGGAPRLHPHNDPSLMDCSRCGCPAGAHEVAEADNARAQGNDAFATVRHRRVQAFATRLRRFTYIHSAVSFVRFYPVVETFDCPPAG